MLDVMIKVPNVRFDCNEIKGGENIPSDYRTWSNERGSHVEYFFSSAWARNLVSLKMSCLDSEVQVYTLVFSDNVPGQGTAEQWRARPILMEYFATGVVLDFISSKEIK